MSDDAARARRLAETIEAALARPSTDRTYKVTKRGACSGCPPSACYVCGAVLPGDVYIIHHQAGKRHLSDKAIHYMGHGMARYQTGYSYRGEPVVVDLDLQELEGYLDLT